MFGDIIAIYQGNTKVAEYAYDAYGNCTIVFATGNAGILNPLRYRGYYFDEDMKLYYLQSRYYDPETGRFINADDVSYLDPESIHGLNLYAYCLNNPVMYKNEGEALGREILTSSVLAGYGSVGGSPSARYASDWLKLVVCATPDIILGFKYLQAKGIHNKFVYSTNSLYIFPEIGGNWARFKIAKHGYGDLVGASFKQTITGSARASWTTVAKSFGKTAALTGLINFGFNFYENDWKIDGAMLLDTTIDTAIGLSAYGLAAGTTSLGVAVLAMAGVTVPGFAVVASVILLSIAFDWIIREIIGYKN